MISDKTKLLCLMTFTLIVSGCSSGGGDEITDPQVIVDDALNVGGAATTEVTASTDISNGMATPVPSVSSGQMDAYINNALLTPVPTELNGDTTTASLKRYVTNPLMN